MVVVVYTWVFAAATQVISTFMMSFCIKQLNLGRGLLGVREVAQGKERGSENRWEIFEK